MAAIHGANLDLPMGRVVQVVAVRHRLGAIVQTVVTVQWALACMLDSSRGMTSHECSGCRVFARRTLAQGFVQGAVQVRR
jgi:hypothetical protein